MARQQQTFDENSKLGFMKVFLIFNIFVIALIFFALVFIKGSTVKLLSYSGFSLIGTLVAMALSVWLIANRKEHSRGIIITLYAAFALESIIYYIFINSSSLSSCLMNVVIDLVIILYFATSRRAKAVLVRPFFDKTIAENQEAKNRELWDLKSKAFWLRLVLYFFIFSIMGHWMEMFVQVLVINKILPGTIAGPNSLTWRDSLNPFFIYGIAFSFCGLVLYPIYMKLKKKSDKKWLACVLSFLLNMTFCVVAELILGFFFNADYHAWDYRNQFMNFQGQICLLYSILFGVLSSVMTWGVFPLLERQFSKINKDVFRIIFFVSLVLYLAIYFTYNVEMDQLMPGAGLSVDAQTLQD